MGCAAARGGDEAPGGGLGGELGPNSVGRFGVGEEDRAERDRAAPAAISSSASSPD